MAPKAIERPKLYGEIWRGLLEDRQVAVAICEGSATAYVWAWGAGDWYVAEKPGPILAAALAAERARCDAEVAELRAQAQALRDAIYQGHAGHTCAQIAETADRALEGEAAAQKARDDARAEVERLEQERDAARSDGLMWQRKWHEATRAR
jgi:hypothetical protein